MKIMTKIAYSERLALEGQQKFNTWWSSINQSVNAELYN